MDKRHRPGKEHKAGFTIVFHFDRETALRERDRFALLGPSFHDDQRSD